MDIVILFAALFGFMALGLSVWISMGAASLVALAILGLGDATSLPTAMARASAISSCWPFPSSS